MAHFEKTVDSGILGRISAIAQMYGQLVSAARFP
jgi:hypothetical protein